MSYIKTTWVNGSAPPINASNLNKIEDGIDNATPILGQETVSTASWQSSHKPAFPFINNVPITGVTANDVPVANFTVDSLPDAQDAIVGFVETVDDSAINNAQTWQTQTSAADNQWI